MNNDFKRPTYNIVDGFRLPSVFTEATYRYTVAYQPNPGDLFFVGYPKCGNTWIMHITYLLTRDLVPLPADKKLQLEIPFMEFEGKDIERFPPPRQLKTHLTKDRLNVSSEAKYIYAARNPRDCCVSFYHHTKGFNTDYFFADGTFDDFFESFMLGELDNNDYFDHLLSWWPMQGQPNFLLLTYEGMKMDPEGAVAKIGKFLGGKAEKLASDPENVRKILDLTDFNKMKKEPSRFQFDDVNFTDFFRKGIVGDWKNYFSAEQVERLDRRTKEKLAGTDIPKLWEAFPGLL